MTRDDLHQSGGRLPDAEPAALLKSTGFLLALLGAESRRLFVDALAAHELRLAHYGALMVLGEAGPMPQQRLARAIGVDPRNAVPIIDTLQGRGYLERGTDPADRRRHKIALTADGRAALARVQRAGLGLEERMLAGLDARERATLQALLVKLYRFLGGRTQTAD